MSPMPAHIQRALIADGVMTEGHLTRTAKARRCPKCGAPTLAAIDDLGGDAWTHPVPVTAYGELQALSAGLRTWCLDQGGLDARDAPFIIRFPADDLKIHAQHECGQRSVYETKPVPPPPPPKPDKPPF